MLHLATAFWLAVACLFAGAGRDAAPMAPVWSANAAAVALDEIHESVRADRTGAADRCRVRVCPARRRRRHAPGSVVSGLVSAVRAVGGGINRWNRPPPAWSGPPILLT